MLANFHIPNGPALLRAAGGDVSALIAAIQEIRSHQFIPRAIKPEEIADTLQKLNNDKAA